MKLTYKTKKLQKLCEEPAFNSLNDVPTLQPNRRHKLSGNLKKYFAINIIGQYSYKK